MMRQCEHTKRFDRKGGVRNLEDTKLIELRPAKSGRGGMNFRGTVIWYSWIRPPLLLCTEPYLRHCLR